MHHKHTTTMLGPVLLLLALRDSLVLGFNELPREQGYEVVYPRKVHTQHRRDTQSQYPETVHYKLQYNGRPLELQLEKTEDLLTNNYTETYYLDDGTPVTTSPLWQDHCYYQGRVKNDNNSQVSLSVCHGLSGLITTQEQKLLIKPLNETEDGAHAVYTYQAQEAPKTCGVDHTMYNESIQTKISFSISNSEKTAFLKARKYIQLYIVADYSMYVKYNYNKDRLRERVYGIVNFVNLVYKPLNIFVALTGLEIWDRGDQFEVVTSANINLDRFSAWRQNKLLPRKPNDNSQFLTHTDFDGATVGLAWVSTLCQDFHSSGVIQDHSTEYIPVGATVAHEMGHNLGMDHDGASCLCSVKSCIMAPILSDTTPREFSSCSHQNYQNFLLNKMPLCMRDVPDKKEVVSSAFCGNKFTEVGEECDCGTEEECTNKCCDAKTCKLKERAQCAEGECCSNCELKAAGTVCRVAKDDCDLSDMCDGTSASCPSDRFKVNGYPCKNGEGHCYNGECPTLQSQCQLRQGQGWGAASSSCFAINREGRDGFCVHNGVKVPCPNRDVNCGVLFCSYRSDRTCYTLNPVLVMNGTRCEQDSVCQNGRCISTDNAYQARDCSAKCPKNAECDHELKCHCKEGWAPPNCDTNTDQLGAGSIALIVLVILAVLVIVIIVFLVLYKVSQRRKQRRTTPRSTGVTNPTFNIGKQKPQKQNMHPSYPSAAQATNGNAMYPPRPPAPSQKPQVSAMYPPQPPASSQKPQVSAMYPPQPPTYYPNQNAALGYQRPTNVIPARPPYPAVPPQAMKPNYRR